MKKICLLITAALMTAGLSFGQEKYCSAEGKSLVEYGYRDGKLDSACTNPKINKTYKSPKCIQYKRSALKFDNVKIHPQGKLENVSSFASYDSISPKLKMKVYSTAPAGTMVEIQFAKKGINDYPKGVHSQFQAKTTKQNEWEELTFNFINSPEGSQVSSTEIDEIIILFSPNTTGNDTYYFGDIIGPKLITASTSPNKK